MPTTASSTSTSDICFVHATPKIADIAPADTMTSVEFTLVRPLMPCHGKVLPGFWSHPLLRLAPAISADIFIIIGHFLKPQFTDINSGLGYVVAARGGLCTPGETVASCSKAKISRPCPPMVDLYYGLALKVLEMMIMVRFRKLQEPS